MTKPFILAHISDAHLKTGGKLAYRKVDTAAALTRCIDTLNRFTPRIDAIIITGDLTDFGKPAEYATLRELLAPLTVPYYLITGNHDRREPLRQTFHDHSYLPAEGKLNWCCDLGALTLIGLDTLVEGRSEGHLCSDTLDWLDHILQQHRDKPVVVSCHQPPIITGIGHMDWQNLHNSDALAAIIRRHPQVQRLLCGHLHRYISQLWAGTLVNIAPGISHQVALDLDPDAAPAYCLEPPGFLLHTLIDNNLVTHYQPIGDYGGKYPFFNPDGSLID